MKNLRNTQAVSEILGTGSLEKLRVTIWYLNIKKVTP